MLVEEDHKSKDGRSSPHRLPTDQPGAEPGKEFQAVLSLTRDRQEIYRKYAQVCTELKLLYVAITRPRKHLFIIDLDPTDRLPILEYWLKLGVVDLISRKMALDHDLLELKNCAPTSLSASSLAEATICAEPEMH